MSEIDVNPQAVEPMGDIQDRLARARKIWRTSVVITRLLQWAGCVVGAVLLLCLLDNLCELPAWLRLILSLGVVFGGLAALALHVLHPLLWRINDQAAAVYLERKTGERENLLINAVQLAKVKAGGNGATSVQMIERVISQAATRAADLNLGELWESKRLRNLGLAAGLAFGLFLAYVLLMQSYARNALARYAKPLSGVPALSRTHVLVFPSGNKQVLSGDSLVVYGLSYVEKGNLPSEAALVTELDGAVRRIPMAPSPAPYAELLKQAKQDAPNVAFVYECPNITKPFTFYLAAGDGRSLPCRVTVKEKPGVEEVFLDVQPPAYTGMGSTHQPAPSGLVHALAGSEAKIVFKATRPLESGQIALPDGKGKTPLKQRSGNIWEAGFQVLKEGTYVISLCATDGVENINALEGRILPQTDALPAVAFEMQTLNISALPGSDVPVGIRAQDDFGLKWVRLVFRKQEGGGDQVEKEQDLTAVKIWPFPIPGPKDTKELYPVTLDPSRFTVGGTYVFYAEATDHCPAEPRLARSAPLLIRVMTPEQMALKPESPFDPLFHRIQKLIDLQTKARGKTITVRGNLQETIQKGLFDAHVSSGRDSQVEVNTATQTLITELAGAKNATVKNSSTEILATLRGLHTGPMAQVVKALEGVRRLQKDQPQALTALKGVEDTQTDIINKLLGLMGTIAALDKEKKDNPASLEDSQDGQRLRDKLEDLKEKVGEFITAQKKVIQSTEELEKKAPEDLTEEDKKKLGELAKEEMDWAKYFREKFTDLSKVPDQDFSNSSLAKELNAVYQEIQKASEALVGDNKEIACRAEEGGLEAAKELQTNLEKWLPDKRDNIKWSMEEPQGKFDVPLADLPAELEDIVGELIDQEDKMTPEVEDVSSSWMDSLDKGAGWDAMDGPISNMSAKGVTGNQLPNNMEIGGRSGEGRTGKSSGQFVADGAEGKGGRQTPSRNTQDPYEAGHVDDKSKDPIGGATGGGKDAGGAAQGLRGQPPPQTAAKMERLKDAQAQLRQEAEKITTKLNAYHLPSSDMEEAVRRMKAIEDRLTSRQGFNLRQAHSNVVDSLRDEKKVLQYQAKINSERSRDLPKNVRHGILTGMQQKAPAGYQDLIEAYYKSLVQENE